MSANGKPKVWLVGGVRTPIASFGKSYRKVKVEDLAEHAIKYTLQRAHVEPEHLDGIVLGHGYQSAYAPNTARVSALKANVPASVPCMTVQRQCGSGMESVNLVMKDIALGNGDLYLAGGVESMSTVPYLVPGGHRFDDNLAKSPWGKQFKFGPRPVATLADDGLVPTSLLLDMKTTHMSGTAQRLADTYNISRQAADEYALRSHQLAVAAQKSGRFAVEIEPFNIPGRGFLEKDEHPRADTSLDKLAAMRPSYKVRDITAGNSSGINDGACTVLVASDAGLKEFGLQPLAQLVDSCVVGVDPEQMGLGPVAAIETLLKRNNLTLADIDLFEVNEAFAHQYLAVEQLLKLPRDKVNVNGGAIALGHPIGMSGARLILTLAHELRLRKLKKGIASLCIGGGMGIATLIEIPPSAAGSQ